MKLSIADKLKELSPITAANTAECEAISFYVESDGYTNYLFADDSSIVLADTIYIEC